MEYAQKLISTRRGTFLLSALAAVLAGGLILVYVNRYRTTVKSEGAPVTVLIARQDIPKGTSGSVIAEKGLFTATTIRQSQLVDGAFSDASSLRDKVTTKDIYANSQLAATDFAISSSNLAASLTDTQRIVAIPLDSAHGLTGQLQAGDKVDIFAGFNVVPITSSGAAASSAAAEPVVRRIMQNVLVVGIASKGAGALSSSSSNVELKVTDQQAANLAFASDNGKLWLALRPSTGGKASAPSLVTVQTLMLGQSPVAALHAAGGH